MLVLSRKKGEKLSIGEDIIVEVLGVDGDRIRLGITAPRDVRIFRTELLEQTINTNKLAAQAAPITEINLKKSTPK